MPNAHKRAEMQTQHKLILFVEFSLSLFVKVHITEAVKGNKLSVQFEHVECRTYTKEIVQSFKCSLRRDDLTKELLLNTDLILAKEVQDATLRFKFAYETNGRMVNFPSVEADICDKLTKRIDFFVLRMVTHEILKKLNIPLNCPLKGDLIYRHLLKREQFIFSQNFLYYIRNFTINPKIFPQFLLDMKWSTYFNFSSEKSATIALDAFGTFKRVKL